MQFSSSHRRARRAILAFGAGMLGLAALPLAPAGAAPLVGFSQTLVTGNAHGGSGDVHIGQNDVTLGAIAAQGLPCITNNGVVYQNHVAEAKVPMPPTVLKAGAVVNKGVVNRNVEFADVLETSQVADLNILDGMITAEALKASSHTRIDATGINKFSDTDDHPGVADGSTNTSVVKLKIGDEVLDGDVEPNTKIQLPGDVGYVIVNEQIFLGPKRTVGGTQYDAGVKVNALHVVILIPAGELKTTADIVIAQARTSVQPSTESILQGQAWAARAIVGPVTVGRQGVLQLPCIGTQGKERTRSIVGVNVPALTLDFVGKATVQGIRTPGQVKTSERIVDLNLFDGRLTADAVTVRAQSIVQAGKVVSQTSMEFVNVVIDGEPISISKPANIEIPGLAKVQFGQSSCKADPGTPTASNSCTANDKGTANITGITISVISDDEPQYPLGTKIWIAFAESGIDKP